MKTTFDAARDSLALSIFPLPIKPGAKRPAANEGWQDLRLTLDDLQEHFGDGQNIGWLLGIKPRPIADVDLDCHEALMLAPLIKGPKTERIAGHKSNPASHYFFELAGEFGTNKFLDPFRKKKEDHPMIIELRGKGCQTIVPPSIHVSGEAYEWAKCGGFGKASHEELLRWVSKIASAALLVRYWQPRHDARLALIGMLAHAEWPEEETLEFVSAVIKCADAEDLREVKGNVKNCYHRVEGDAEAFGAPKLREMLGDQGKQIIKTVFDWLALNRASPSGMITSLTGVIKPILANALTALRDSKWDAIVGLNEFSLHIVTRKDTPFGKAAGEKWTDIDDIDTSEWLQKRGVCVNSQVASDAIRTIAAKNTFHPVREYLNLLKWDGVERIDTWLTEYIGAKDTEFARAVGSRWLISGVARIFRPGCQADHTLLLEGPQGIRKSTALRTLASEEWFTDHISDLDSKDSRMELHGVWIVELAELSAVRRSLAEKVKSFLTATTDHFRPPYGRSTIVVPRQNIFAGSVNDETPFTDETGNRRFWPVRCGTIFTNKLEDHRDQLWAEAVVRYKNKSNWWLETTTLNTLAEEEQKQRYQAGVWDDDITRWLERCQQNEVTIADVLNGAIKKKLDAWTQGDRIAIAKCLRSNGWNQSIVKDDNRKSKRIYRRPNETE